jgi:hypothetical protein
MLSMITKIIEGKEGISYHEHSGRIRRSQNVGGDHDTFVGSFQENATKQRRRQAGNDDVKVIGTTDKMQARN